MMDHSSQYSLCSFACQGTPTLLSLDQMAWLCKKKASSLKAGNAWGIVTGETDDIYKFLGRIRQL
jgi:hypothetical protein